MARLFIFPPGCDAQWSTDPAAPMVVTNVANAARYSAAIADADSGYYVFWSDLRNDPAKGDLYGQHFDSEGNALWTAGGELMLSNPTKSINQVAPLLMPDGSVIVAYMTRTDILGGDTVRAMRFDADASALWAEPSVLLTGLDYRSMKMVVSDSCAYMVAYCESCSGGGYGCKLQRVPRAPVQLTVHSMINPPPSLLKRADCRRNEPLSSELHEDTKPQTPHTRRLSEKSADRPRL